MPQKEALTNLTGVVSPLLLSDVKNPQELCYTSPFLPRYWTKTVPFAIDHVRITPCNNAKLNAENIFEIAKLGHGISDFIIRTTFPPGTVTGGVAGTQANYTDHLGYDFWEQMKLNFLSNDVYDVKPYDCYFEYRRNFEVEKRDAINDEIQGDKSTAIRTANFANGVTVMTDFFLPFVKASKKMLPLCTLSQKVRATLITRPLNEFTRIQVPTVSNEVATFNNVDISMELILEIVHLSVNESSYFLAMSQEQSGIGYMIHKHINQLTERIATLTPNARVGVSLCGISKPIRILSFALLPEAMSNNTNRNDRFFFNPNPPPPIPAGLSPYAPITQWEIEANGHIIVRALYEDQSRIHLHRRYCISPHGDYFYDFYFGLEVDAVDKSTGFMDFSNLPNAKLYITTGADGTGRDLANPQNPQVLNVIVNAEDYNYWYMKKGNWSKSFH